MRRLLRWTFHALAAASLLLCIVTAGLWVRSYWVNDEFFAQRKEGSFHGRSGAQHYQCLVVSGHGNLFGWFWSSERPEDRPIPPWEIQFDHPTDPFANWTAFGRGYWHGPSDRGAYMRTLAVPHWSLVAAFALLPAVVAFRQVRAVRRRRRRSRLGLCPACGYDLRASPGRCPECGRPGDKAKG